MLNRDHAEVRTASARLYGELMSTPLGRSALVVAALAALLGGCAAPVPAVAPDASESSTAAEPEPTPQAEFACSDLDEAMPAGFEAADPFGSPHTLATVAVGGVSCVWWPVTDGVAVSQIAVTLLPAALLEDSAATGPTCGELIDQSSGCYARELIEGVVAETLVQGDPAAPETSSLMETVAAAASERLAEGALPLASTVESPINRIDCQGLDLGAAQLPDDVGSFATTQFGGTDAGGPTSELVSRAMQAAGVQIGCSTGTTRGFGIGMSSLGRGGELLDDPRLVGGSVPLELESGRPARILLGTTAPTPLSPSGDFAQVAIDIDGSVVFLSVYDRNMSGGAASIDQAATAITDAIVGAIDARESESNGGSDASAPPSGWPAVAVPPASTPRLSVTCDELLAASGSPGTTTIALPMTAQTIGVRQGGGTVCAFALETPGGPANAVLLLAAGVDGASTKPVTCATNGWKSDTVTCRGAAVANAGVAEIEYEMPAGAQLTWGASAAQSLLDAAAGALSSDPELGPVPSIHPDSLGAGQKYCDPSAEQKAAIFGIFPEDSSTDISGGMPGTTHIEYALHGSVGTLACNWWVGIDEITVEVIPGAGWIVDELDGPSVDVVGAVAAIRTEREVLEYVQIQQVLMPEIAIVASARGSAVIVHVAVDPSMVSYWDRRLPRVAAAIIATNP